MLRFLFEHPIIFIVLFFVVLPMVKDFFKGGKKFEAENQPDLDRRLEEAIQQAKRDVAAKKAENQLRRSATAGAKQAAGSASATNPAPPMMKRPVPMQRSASPQAAPDRYNSKPQNDPYKISTPQTASTAPPTIPRPQPQPVPKPVVASAPQPARPKAVPSAAPIPAQSLPAFRSIHSGPTDSTTGGRVKEEAAYATQKSKVSRTRDAVVKMRPGSTGSAIGIPFNRREMRKMIIYHEILQGPKSMRGRPGQNRFSAS